MNQRAATHSFPSPTLVYSHWNKTKSQLRWKIVLRLITFCEENNILKYSCQRVIHKCCVLMSFQRSGPFLMHMCCRKQIVVCIPWMVIFIPIKIFLFFFLKYFGIKKLVLGELIYLKSFRKRPFSPLIIWLKKREMYSTRYINEVPFPLKDYTSLCMPVVYSCVVIHEIVYQEH